MVSALKPDQFCLVEGALFGLVYVFVASCCFVVEVFSCWLLLLKLLVIIDMVGVVEVFDCCCGDGWLLVLE